MPFDRSKYPANWSEIRARILERANHQCERCGRRNHSTAIGKLHNIKIVLTIAHIENPDPMDVRDENLQALCQRCHQKLDGPLHALHAAETRRLRHGAT